MTTGGMNAMEAIKKDGKKLVFDRAGVVLVGEELESTLGSNFSIFQEMFQHLEYDQFCNLMEHLEKGGRITIDLNSYQEIGGHKFPSLVKRYEMVSLDDIKHIVEPDFSKNMLPYQEVAAYMDYNDDQKEAV